MLGLRQQVGGHKGGLGLFIGNDHHLGRSGRHINGHGAACDPLFGGGHVAVAGAENLIHFGHRTGSVGHGGHGLGASQAENAPDAAVGCGVQHFRGDVAVRTGRRTEDYLRTTGDGGRDGQHQHGGEQGSGTARNIETHPSNGNRTLDAAHAGGRFHHNLAGQLGLVEGADMAGGRGDGFAHLGCNFCSRGCKDLGAYLQREAFLPGQDSQRPPVNLQRQGLQGGIAFRADPLQDGIHPGGYLRIVFPRARA